jgi:hypothetical protein
VGYEQIKEEVKERYGKIALAGKSSEGAPSLTNFCELVNDSY